MPLRKIPRPTKKNTKEAFNKNSKNKLYKSLEENMNIIKEIFSNDDTLICRTFENQQNKRIKCCIFYIEGMADSRMIYESIIQPIVTNSFLNSKQSIVQDLHYGVIVSNDIENTGDMNAIIQSILNGDTALLVDDEQEALLIRTKGWKLRSISEPESERAIRAPREGFIESLTVNLTLIRRKLKTPNLKFNCRTMGVRSNTKVCICYIEGIADEKILQELNKRLDGINIDGIIGTNYIQELITDNPFSPFDSIGYTERPDIVCGKLLEGRIGILVDGTSFCLTIPHIFIELFQSNDDYYENFYFSSFARLLRIIGFISTIIIPGIYLALTSFHHEIIPTLLFMSIQAARSQIPIPIVFEAIELILVFEILKEAGSRMPTYIGQALSIVGAIVIGQAAVDARIVSAPMVIIVAFSGITSLMINRLKTPATLLRIIFLLLASVLGLYGVVFGITGLIIHLLEMRSFGIPYMSNTSVVSSDFQDLKDTYIRAPWWYMENRPKFIAAKNIVRKASGGRKP